MAWGTDLLAGLGGAMGGGLAMHQQQKVEARQAREDEYRRVRDEQVDELKKQLQEMKGEQGSAREKAKAEARMALQEVMHNQAMDLQGLKGDQAQVLQQMEDQRMITHDQAVTLRSMDLRKEIEAGLNRRNTENVQGRQSVANTQAASAGNVATIGANSRITVEGMGNQSAEEIAAATEKGRQERAVRQGLVGAFQAESQARSAANRAAAATGGAQQPMKPWGGFINEALVANPPVAQRPLNPAAPPPSSGMPLTGGFSPAPPGGVPVAPQVAPGPQISPAAPLPAAPPPRVPAPQAPLFGPGSGGFSGLSTPGKVPPVAGAPSGPVLGGGQQGPGLMTEVTMAAKVSELTRQIRAADAKRDKATANRLRAELKRVLGP